MAFILSGVPRVVKVYVATCTSFFPTASSRKTERPGTGNFFTLHDPLPSFPSCAPFFFPPPGMALRRAKHFLPLARTLVLDDNLPILLLRYRGRPSSILFCFLFMYVPALRDRNAFSSPNAFPLRPLFFRPLRVFLVIFPLPLKRFLWFFCLPATFENLRSAIPSPRFNFCFFFCQDF